MYLFTIQKASLYSLLFLLLPSISLFGWSDSSRSEKPILPELNVYGKLNGIEVNYITINNLYKHIPMYLLPAEKNGNPRDSVAFIDLVPSNGQPAITSISLVKTIRVRAGAMDIEEDYNLEGSEIAYHDIHYFKVLITFASGVHRTYLLDSDTSITCYDRMLDIEYKITLKALHALIIDGYETEDQKRTKKQSTSDSHSLRKDESAKKSVCQSHADTIDALKKEPNRSAKTNELIKQLNDEASLICQED